MGVQFRAELAYGFTTAAGLLRPYTMVAGVVGYERGIFNEGCRGSALKQHPME